MLRTAAEERFTLTKLGDVAQARTAQRKVHPEPGDHTIPTLVGVQEGSAWLGGMDAEGSRENLWQLWA